MDGRQRMIDGMQVALQEESAHWRGIIVDAVINGIMSYLHECARNTKAHEDAIAFFGGGFQQYAQKLADEVIGHFANSAQMPPSPQPAPPPAGQRRRPSGK